MSNSRDTEKKDPAAWRCVRAKPKSEHIAAAHLQQLPGVEVLCPRIRFLKSTRRGKVWFNEALFPGYLFARFRLKESLRAVSSANAVTKVVRFGDDYPVIEEGVIEELRRRLDLESLITIEAEMEKGDEVEVVEGPMRGMIAVVTRVLPARERVRILLEFLGHDREVDVAKEDLLSKKEVRTAAFVASGEEEAEEDSS